MNPKIRVTSHIPAFALVFVGMIFVSGADLPAALVQERPDFSGTWILNTEESRLQIGIKIESAKFTIEHREPQFRFGRVFIIGGKEDSLSYVLTTDGKEKVGQEPGRTTTSRLYWDAEVLVLDERIVLGDGREATNTVRYSLRDGGAILVAEERFRGPIRKHDNLWVARRADPAEAAASDVMRHVPNIEDLLAIKSAGGACISPDGTQVAYTVTEADFEQDAYLTQIWLAEVATHKTIQLTRGKKSCSDPVWSPDGRWLAFTSSRADDKSQIFAINPDGGEAIQLTKSETGVSRFAWSPDGKTIAFTSSDPVSSESKARKDFYGDYEVVRREYTYVHLWTVDAAEALRAPQPGRRRTSGKAFTVGGFDWSPDGTKIAFSATIDPDLVNGVTSDIYLLELAGDAVKKVVDQPGPDSSPRWSPDGRSILFSSALGRPDDYVRNSRLAVVPAEGGAVRSLTDTFDNDPSVEAWNTEGIWFSAIQRTSAHLFRLDPESLKIDRVSAPSSALVSGFSFSADGRTIAFSIQSPATLPEIGVSGFPWKPRTLTRMSDQITELVLGTREVISWKSKDGTEIEGVLIKPAGFDPAKRYALLCIIHGGPRSISMPVVSADLRHYPADIWAARGALILKVNYRGSAGYGERFLRLNIRNLGVGDAWDVLSGVDYLVKKGWVDPDRVGCMGWSQGGYISAFLTTATRAFKAISVGAGISNWATYYYNTDVTPFTIQYLGDDPVDDPAIYARTSPMAYIKRAVTPTLIQHGEFDRRVPIPNAYELRQGLTDRGVPVEMVVYKGYGHGITKPKSMRAVMAHNLAWFGHYIFGDPKPDLSASPIPKKATDKEKGGSEK